MTAQSITLLLVMARNLFLISHHFCGPVLAWRPVHAPYSTTKDIVKINIKQGFKPVRHQKGPAVVCVVITGTRMGGEKLNLSLRAEGGQESVTMKLQ